MKQEFQNAQEERVTEQDEAMMRDFLMPLRALETPNETRQAVRRRLMAGLEVAEEREERARQRWWRRRLSVPVPIAAGILALLVALPVLAPMLHGSGKSSRSAENPSSARQAGAAQVGSPAGMRLELSLTPLAGGIPLGHLQDGRLLLTTTATLRLLSTAMGIDGAAAAATSTTPLIYGQLDR